MESIDGHSTAGAFRIRDPLFQQTNRAKAMTVPFNKTEWVTNLWRNFTQYSCRQVILNM